jgi:two-component system nitrogen regulation response regulator NtrX
MFPSILIVDDEPYILKSLSDLLKDEGFEVTTASNGYEALQMIESESPDLVLLDIWMPGMDGIETLKEIKKENPFIQVIIITGHGTIETAVQATKLGAYDLIEKPLSIDAVIVAINNALNFRRLEEENRYLRKKTLEKHSITGDSPATQKLKLEIMTAAPTDAWVLISGENGTGKELVARTLHQLSPRVEKPFIEVNCAVIPEDQIESELFGHEKGAFPGAVAKKQGKFELAGDGTLFLDEISDMSLNNQAKLLRVLQELKYQRMGGRRTLTTSARIIAATNRDLQVEIEKGRFREDLYYRLNVIPIHVPTLQQRKEDIRPLAELFLRECSHRSAVPKVFAEDAIEVLEAYPWPGNVRELKNLAERLSVMVDSDAIRAADIPPSYAADHAVSCPPPPFLDIDSLKDARRKFEREYILHKLAENDNNVSQTAKDIGVDRSYLHKKLKAYRKL